MQRMTDFCQIVPMSRLFETLERRVLGFLRDTSVHWTFLTASRHSSNEFGSALDFATFLRDVAASRHSSNEFGSALDFATLLRFSLIEAVEKSVRYIIRAK